MHGRVYNLLNLLVEWRYAMAQVDVMISADRRRMKKSTDAILHWT